MNMARTTEPVTLTGTWDVLLSHTALLGAAMVVEEELGAGAVRLVRGRLRGGRVR